jgi:hypothetical protein
MQGTDLRLRIAAVATSVAGVNVDNFIKFCNTLEEWVGATASGPVLGHKPSENDKDTQKK